MIKRIILLLLCYPLAVSAFAQDSHPVKTSRNARHAAKKADKNPKIHIGTASFYANKFNGRITANGEVFSQKKLTAACNILPLNTFVCVTNLRNHRKVVVKITDRMHHSNKRLIDLSRLAAQKLRYTGWGLAKVKVELIGKIQPNDWVMEPAAK